MVRTQQTEAKGRGLGGEELPLGIQAFSSLEWIFALRYLRSRRRETFISIIAGFSFFGIMLGVATLIVVMAVMNGFRTELLSKILAVNGHILLQPLDRPLDDYKIVTERLARVKGVTHVVPYVEGQALASTSIQASGVLVRGVNQKDLLRLLPSFGGIVTGSLSGFDESETVAIGMRLAEMLGVTVGDAVTLVAPRGAITPMGVAPRVKSYTVSAIFSVGMSEYDARLLYMPLQEAQLYFNQEDVASGIDVFLEDPDKVGTLRQDIEAAVERPILISDWRFANKTFFSALEVERNVLFMILALIILVAALNIVSGLTMLVKEKAHAIAILRSMGATRGFILRVFFIAGASIGVTGTAFGLALGALVCANIESIRQFVSWLTRAELFSPELYFLTELPAKIQSFETLFVVILSLSLSFLAVLYPAWRAAYLDPVEALRYE